MNIFSVNHAPVTATQITASAPDNDTISNANKNIASALPGTPPPSLQKQAVLKLVSGLDNLDSRLQSVAGELKKVENLCRQPAASPNDYEVADYIQARQGQSASLNTALKSMEDALETRQPQQHLIDIQLQLLAGSALPRGVPGPSLDSLPLPPEPELHLAPAAQMAQKGAGGDFFLELNGMIKFIRNDYLSAYEMALQRYSDFYKSFNENVMSKMGSSIEGTSDGKSVNVPKSVSDMLQAELNKIKASQHLIPIMDTATIQRWAKVFPGTVVKDAGNGKSWLAMDISPLENMTSALMAIPYHNYWTESRFLDNAQFQAWQTGFNTQEAEMKNQLQVLSTKYGNANSYHENFNKILSSQLSQYAEMLKSIVSGI